jgi:hypothetical protein
MPGRGGADEGWRRRPWRGRIAMSSQVDRGERRVHLATMISRESTTYIWGGEVRKKKKEKEKTIGRSRRGPGWRGSRYDHVTAKGWHSSSSPRSLQFRLRTAERLMNDPQRGLGSIPIGPHFRSRTRPDPLSRMKGVAAWRICLGQRPIVWELLFPSRSGGSSGEG